MKEKKDCQLKFRLTKKLNESSGEKTNIINYRTKLRLNEKWQNETRYVFYILVFHIIFILR